MVNVSWIQRGFNNDRIKRMMEIIVQKIADGQHLKNRQIIEEKKMARKPITEV